MGTETVLHSFGGSGDGAEPQAALLNVNGKLYGTTTVGGANCTGGCGTVFAITPSGTETVLHSFGGSGDGRTPSAPLISIKGTLYGTTYNGGKDGDGTVFSITPSGTEKVIYNFQGGSGDGAVPVAALLNINGTLYGTTCCGGANNDGTVFAITTSGTETVLHSFGGSGDGASPEAALVNVNGTLYGTTPAGGAYGRGTVFAITPSGKEQVIYSFGGSPGDGSYPVAGLINVRGTLYSTTEDGGQPTKNGGTVFSITPSGGKETVLHSFGGSGDGAFPFAALINVSGNFYGTTVNGGTNSDGTVFALTP